MKQFSKIKQLADKAFVRPDRTEVLSETLLDAERRIELIKQTCEITVKKVSGCLQSHGKEMKEGTAIEKRIKKVPEFIMGSSMVEYGTKLGNASTLGEVLEEAGKIEMKVGSEMIEFEEKIEKLILIPLQKLIFDDIPSIYKLKRTLSKLTENMDNARARLSQASNRHSMSGTTGEKMINYKEEVEDSQQKVEQCRDNLCAEMYQLIARETEIAQYIVLFLKCQMEYHQKISSTLYELLPEVEAILSNGNHKTVYGTDLVEHLNVTQRTIAAPIELCICGLLELGLEEEGLLRLTGSASKVKKLKAEFDVGIIDLHGLLVDICDPHVISNALKCYLRELPQPLLTTELYQDWLSAIRVTDNQDKLQALWKVVQKLPEPNQNNLRYLIKFFKQLSDHQDINKMSPSNIAIVIGPNILWAPTSTNSEDPTENSSTMDLTLTHLFSSIVDQLITYADWFFPGDIEFFISCKRPTEEDLATLTGRLQNGLTSGSIAEGTEDSAATDRSVKRSQSTSSLDDNSPPQCSSPKPILRRKNKQAPIPPANAPAPVPTAMTKSVVTPALPAEPPRKQMTHARHGSAGTTPFSSSYEREKREGGFYIPPSPSQMKTNTVTASATATATPEKKVGPPPPKPPQPNLFLREKTSSTETPTPTSTTKLSSKSSSFRSQVGSVENEILEKSTAGTTIPSGSTSLQYSVSLPRRFHTENSYKNKIQTTQGQNVKDSAETSITTTASDKEKDAVKVDEQQQVTEKEKPVPVTSTLENSPRPVPAPRSSLSGSVVPPPTIKERPSLMAKPKDLTTKRTQQVDAQGRPKSVGSGGESDDGQRILGNAQTEDLIKSRKDSGGGDAGSTVRKASGEHEVLEKSDGHGGVDTPSRPPQPLQSPVNPTQSPFRPPRPHPPPPPKGKSSVPGESTDL